MKYALVDGIKVEAYKGLKGVCPICGSSLISRCGNRKIHHWAHKGILNCDSWWEPETEWHRNWKNNFPIDWQEYLMNDSVTGERHVADIRTETELVIEFQHSFINSKEQSSRESFYKNMIWVVECSTWC
jgi:competence CoiA-like predicted nuclease